MPVFCDDVGWHFDKVKRLALRFNAEDPQNFALRVKGPALLRLCLSLYILHVVKCKWAAFRFLHSRKLGPTGVFSSEVLWAKILTWIWFLGGGRNMLNTISSPDIYQKIINKITIFFHFEFGKINEHSQWFTFLKFVYALHEVNQLSNWS